MHAVVVEAFANDVTEAVFAHSGIEGVVGSAAGEG